MIALIPKENISVQNLKMLRNISNLSISEIKQAAINRRPIREFEEFGSSWETDRVALSELTKTCTENQNLPYEFVSLENSEIDEFFTPKTLLIKLSYLRQIELETQKNSDLENGYIANPDEFEPHDEDWTIIE